MMIKGNGERIKKIFLFLTWMRDGKEKKKLLGSLVIQRVRMNDKIKIKEGKKIITLNN